MRVLSFAVLLCACSSPSRAQPDAVPAGDADVAIDVMVDAAAPPIPRHLALAVSGQRSSVRIFVATTTSFRKIFELADPLGYGNGIAWTDYDADHREDLVSNFSVPNMPGQYEMLVLHNDGDGGISVIGRLPGSARRTNHEPSRHPRREAPAGREELHRVALGSKFRPALLA